MCSALLERVKVTPVADDVKAAQLDAAQAAVNNNREAVVFMMSSTWRGEEIEAVNDQYSGSSKLNV